MISFEITQWNRYANVWVDMRDKKDNWKMIFQI